MKNSCSLFFYDGHLDLSPTLISLSQILNERDYLVNIYSTKDKSSNPIKVGEHTKVTYFYKSNDIPLISLLRELLSRIKLGSFVPLLDLIVFNLQFFSYLLFIWLFRRDEFKAIKHDSVNLGVDKIGSIAAFAKSQLLNQKNIYISLELIHPKLFGKLPFISDIINGLERWSYRESECVLIQDESRFKTLSDYNQYTHPFAFYLPNSLYESGDLVHPALEKNYFRELFQLDETEHAYIILQAGMITPEVSSEEIAQAFAAIDKPYALVFNTGSVMRPEDPYIQLLKTVNQKNLFLSLNPVSYEEIHKVYESATIGLALYRGMDANFSQISLASGKLAQYLKYGKPVIASNLESLADMVNQYQFGVIIDDPSDPIEIVGAIETILSDYDRYCHNARHCFEMEYDFKAKAEPVLAFIDALTCESSL